MPDIADSPFISVIIPTYNRADVVKRAIASVQEQSYQNWEIIVVDDASEDDTEALVKKIDCDRLQYICHPTNLGGSAARNTGIEQAQSKYVAFLDSDDVWLPKKLELQLQAIDPTDSDRLVCYSQFQKSCQVFYQKSVLPARGKGQSSVAEYLWLDEGEMLTSTLLISCGLAKATLFNTELVKHQDLDFVIRLEQRGAKFIFVPQVLSIWHNEPRGDRISRRVDYQASLDWIAGYQAQIGEGPTRELSNRAYLGFLLKEIVPKMIKEPAKKSEANNLIWQAWRSNVISTNYGLYLLVKSAIPRQFQQQIIKLIEFK